MRPGYGEVSLQELCASLQLQNPGVVLCSLQQRLFALNSDARGVGCRKEKGEEGRAAAAAQIKDRRRFFGFVYLGGKAAQKQCIQAETGATSRLIETGRER